MPSLLFSHRLIRRRPVRNAAGVVSALLLAHAGGVHATDFTTISQRVIAQDLTGLPSVTTVQSDMSSLQSNGSWADINYSNGSSTDWPAETHVDRLLNMTQLYADPGSSLYENATLGTDISTAYNYWISTNPQSSNWWYNDIGSLQPLGSTMVLMGSNFSAGQVNSGLTFLARAHAALPTYGGGQNTIDLAIVGIDQAIASANTSTMTTAFSEIGGTIAVTPGIGIQYDNSFQEHGPQLYIGGYGQLYDADVLNVASLAAGTSYAITTAQEELIVNQLLDGTQWFIRGQALDLTSSGRGDSRSGISTAGTSYESAIESALALGTYRETELEAFLARQEAAVSSGVASSTQNTLSGNKNFFDSDIMVQQRPTYYESIKISSVRTSQTESGNGEGLTNLYMSDGVNQIMVTGSEYTNIEPVWNWRMLPGTTVEQDTRSLQPTADWGVTGTATYAGGVSDGTYGAEAFNYNRYDVAAKKSWYFFDNEEVALGAAITSSNKSYPVYTTLNQSLLTSTISYETTASSTAVNMSAGSVTPAGLKWVYQGGVGYFFISPISNATIEGMTQTGSWSEINTSQSASQVSQNVFTLFINHGTVVSNGSYGYIAVPGITAEGMDAYLASNPIQVLSNTSTVQAVQQLTLGITQAAFYNTGSFSIVTGQTVAANAASILMMQRQTDSMKLSASNPQNAQLNLQVTLTGVTLSGSTASWFDALGTATALMNLPGGSLAGSTVGFTLSSDGNATPTVSLSSDDGVSAYTYTVKASVALPANTTFQTDALSTLVFSLPLSGAASLTKTGPGAMNLSGVNLYTGITTINAGAVNVTADESGATGGWSIGSANTNASTVAFTTGSSVVVAAGDGIRIGGTGASNTGAETLNVAGSVVNNGTLAIGRVGTLNLSSGAAWTQYGSTSVTSYGGYSTNLTINTGATFNYAGASAIALAAGSSGYATLTLAGGELMTGAPFSETSSTSSYGTVILNTAGTLLLSANIPSLITSASSTPLQLGTGGGSFNTSSFATTINAPISDVSGQSGLLTKLGSGMLTLSAANLYSGGTNISSGTILATNSTALGTGPVAILISGTSTASLQLSGGITITNTFGGFGSEDGGYTPTIESISGNNTITAPLSITSTGGNGAIFQSDAGTLNLSGGLTTTLTSSRIYYFQGAGAGHVLGNITDSSSRILQVVKGGTGTWTLFGVDDTYAAGTNVSAGTLVFDSPGAFPAFTKLTIAGTAVAAAHQTSIKNSLFVSALTFGGVTNNCVGTLDLTNNDLVVRNGSLGTLTAQIRQGYNPAGGGNWQGSGGILSSTAAADSTHLSALGIIQNSADGTPTGTALFTSFDGQPVINADVIVKYTYYGDADLNGKVDGTDYSRIDAGALSKGGLTGWYNGDFNYDGVIDGSDYTLIDNAFNTQRAQLTASVATSTAQIAGSTNTAAVPEPAIGLLAVSVISLISRRQRRSGRAGG